MISGSTLSLMLDPQTQKKKGHIDWNLRKVVEISFNESKGAYCHKIPIPIPSSVCSYSMSAIKRTKNQTPVLQDNTHHDGCVSQTSHTSSLNMLLRSVGLPSALPVVPKLLCPLRCALVALSFPRPGAVSTIGLGLAVLKLPASWSSPKGSVGAAPCTSSSYL